MIRVVLVEDQTIVRRGIASLLELTEEIRVVAEAVDGEEAIGVIAEAAPDVVLMDIRLPKRSGIETLEHLNQLGQAPPTIFLTTFDDDTLFWQAVRAGARGFLLKDVSEERLAEAIVTVAGGGTLLQPAVTARSAKVVRELRPEFTRTALLEQLTPYEMQILRFVAGGFSNREIADRLQTTEGGVKNHVSTILGKLGVRDRTRAVLRAIELGVL